MKSGLPSNAEPSWGSLIRVFLQLGSLGFGGPQAHLALLRSVIVERHHWVEATAFEEGLALCEALPGPSSSQMAILLGWSCRGLLGGLISGICFLLPGLLVVLVLSELWRRGQGLAGTAPVALVMQPLVAALIWSFALTLLQRLDQRWQWWSSGGLFAAISAGSLIGIPVPVALALVLCGASRLLTPRRQWMVLPWWAVVTMPVLEGRLELLLNLASVFLKAGLLVFGGGFVIIPLLENEVLAQRWLSSGGFLDGVAIGQLSPGPVVLTSAFVGYQAGWSQGSAPFAILAALVATAAIFAPSFVFILIGAPVLQTLRQQSQMQRFLEGVRAAIPGAVAAAALTLSIESLGSVLTPTGLAQWLLLLAATTAHQRMGLKAEWMLLSGLLAGVAWSALR